MKKKVFRFEEGKKKEAYIREIKQLLINNAEAETEAGYDKKGNYIITVMIPNWKDKLKLRKTPKVDLNKTIQNRQYNNYKGKTR